VSHGSELDLVHKLNLNKAFMYAIEFDLLSGNQDIIITKMTHVPEKMKGLCAFRDTFTEAMKYTTEWIEKENARRIKENYPLANRRYLIHYQE
jgi:hypothetical protein